MDSMEPDNAVNGEADDELLFGTRELKFFRSKLDEFTVNIFLAIAKENRQHKGLVKTRLEGYRSKRFHYDQAFTILDAQGFIEKKDDGTMNPYFLTKRGMQLLRVLLDERKK